MKKYRVALNIRDTEYVEIEAENEREAEKKAMKLDSTDIVGGYEIQDAVTQNEIKPLAK